ncbi:MAG: hypothetical protein JO202_14505 [Ktedonobacteraceae bacterium]|nr:hypothetical protein [Ktedonobacteraceae bacterium]
MDADVLVEDTNGIDEDDATVISLPYSKSDSSQSTTPNQIKPYTAGDQQPMILARPHSDVTWQDRNNHSPVEVSPAGYAVAGQKLRGDSSDAKGRAAALVIILLGLLLVLGTMVLFAVQQGVLGFLAGQHSNSDTAAQQAQAVVTQYYDDINSQRYMAAYDLWKKASQTQTLQEFRSGYRDTVHDDIIFNNVAVQDNGTVRISVTVVATERVGVGVTRQRTYTGYYIVGQQNGTWKIWKGNLV